MFSKKKDNTPTNTHKKTPTTSSNALNSLVQGTVVEGSINSESDIRIDGTIKGNLTCKAKVIIGPAGFVDGEVNCVNAMIEGRFNGTLHVSELLNVRETADVSGEIFTNKLIVQSGAVFNVSCKMGNQQTNGTAGTNKSAVKEFNRGEAAGAQKKVG